MGKQTTAKEEAIFTATQGGRSSLFRNRHIRKMTEIFEELSVVEDPVSVEDKVVHLLASLPGCFGVLVTAFEANSETIPKMDVVTERLLHEERKLKEKGIVPVTDVDPKALAAERRSKRRLITCHFCLKHR